MASVTKSVKDLVDAQPGVDNQATFDVLWQITSEMFEKVRVRFELEMDPCSADLQPYGGKDGAQGYLAAYSGPQIDWLIHSYTGNPKASFTNMHLTIGLGPHIDVPNFIKKIARSFLFGFVSLSFMHNFHEGRYLFSD